VSQTEPFDLSRLPLSGSLPSLPAVALDVLRVCQDPDADIDRLATALSCDPTLASRVLQMANSPVYNRGHEITSIQRASMMLGLRALKILALGFTLTSELPHSGSSAGFDLGTYWHRSAVTGVMGRTLASAVGSKQVEEAFLAGLLSYIGKLALAQGMPARYRWVVAASGGWPSETIERERLGFTSSQVGEALLAAWGVPELIRVAASFAERLEALPATAPEETRRLAGLTELAVLAASVFFDEDKTEPLTRFSDAAERRHALGPADVDALVRTLERGVTETAEMFSLDIPSGLSYQAILDEARMQMVAVSLDAMMHLEHTEKVVDELARENEALEARATTDALTGLPNRAALEDFLAKQTNLRARSALPDSLGMLMIDVDRFKSFNDTYGHQAGDEVLRTVAAAMQEVTRGSDLLARYGGEEFCVVMPQTTPESLRVAGERLRSAVEARTVDLGSPGTVRVTASLGGACLAHASGVEHGTQLIEVADQWLYRAKQGGRNRVEVCPEPVVPRERADAAA
jgi:diguanylate cyclase (GGDEF)-like protein